MRNLKLIALTTATTVTLLGAPFTSMAASSCNNAAAALKNYGITTSGNITGSCGNTNSGNNSNTQSIIDYLNGKTGSNSSCGTTGNNSSCGTTGNSNMQSIIDYLNGKTNNNSTGQTDSTCKPGQDCSNTSTDTTKPGNSSSSQYAQQVVNLVNAERAKAGLSPVSVDTKVENAAQVRAQEIVTSFSHTRPNGSAFGTALKAAGVSYKACGENIAYGQKSPEAVMNAWMNSSGHRANIMNPNFKYIGVGYYQTNGVNYWVQEFTY